MLNKIIQLIGFMFFLLAIWLIGKEIRDIGIVKLWQIILSTPWWVIGLVLSATGLDFIVLCGYDILGLKYIQKRILLSKIAEASSIGFAVSNTVGHAYVSGGSIRYLLYGPIGLNRIEILKLIAFETLTIFIGIGASYILSMTIAPFEGILRTNPYLIKLYLFAILILIIFFLYELFIIIPQKNFHIGSALLPAPTQKITIWQLIIGICDNFCVFLAFYCILRFHFEISCFETFSIFIIAQTIGQITQVPGGLGVFESCFLYFFPHKPEEKAIILTSLVIFRTIYYFLPFILASLYLLIRLLTHKLNQE